MNRYSSMYAGFLLHLPAARSCSKPSRCVAALVVVRFSCSGGRAMHGCTARSLSFASVVLIIPIGAYSKHPFGPPTTLTRQGKVMWTPDRICGCRQPAAGLGRRHVVGWCGLMRSYKTGYMMAVQDARWANLPLFTAIRRALRCVVQRGFIMSDRERQLELSLLCYYLCFSWLPSPSWHDRRKVLHWGKTVIDCDRVSILRGDFPRHTGASPVGALRIELYPLEVGSGPVCVLCAGQSVSRTNREASLYDFFAVTAFLGNG